MKIAAWKDGGTDTLYHYCPACERLHVIPPNRWTRGPDDLTWNPSFLQYDAAGKGKDCHYFLHGGKIEWAGGSWHGRTGIEDMPDIPDAWLVKLGVETFVTTDAVFDR